MTVWHLNNLTGSPVNDGLTALTAKSGHADLFGVALDLDVVKQKYTGTNYVFPTSTSVTQAAYGAIRLLLTWEDGDSVKPINKITKNANNFYALCGSSLVNIVNVDWEIDCQDITLTNTPFTFNSLGTGKLRLTNSDVRIYRTGSANALTALNFQLVTGTTSAGVIANNSRILGDKRTYTLRFGNVAQFTDCDVFGFNISSGTGIDGLAASTRCRFYLGQANTANNYIFGTGLASSVNLFAKNSVLIYESGLAVSGTPRVVNISGFVSQQQYFDNIFVNLATTNPPNLYASTSAITQLESEYLAMGNNVYFGTAYTEHLTNFREDYGTSDLLPSNPFLNSTDMNDPDFMKLDTANSGVQTYIKNQSMGDALGSIGAESIAAGGETDPNKVLTTSTLITGNYIPVSNADVRFGTNVGLSQTGLVKVPGVADVRAGVDVDQTVGTLDVDTEANLPAPSEVLIGSGNYGENLDIIPTADVDILANLPATNEVLTGSGNYGKDLDLVPNYTPDFPSASNVLPNDTTNGVTGTADVDLLANLPAENEVLTGTGSYGKNLDKVPSYTPDFPAASNVLPTDTTNGVQGTADVDVLANLPAQGEVLTGSGLYGYNLDKTPSYSPDFPSASNVRETDTTNGEQGLIPNNKIAPSQSGSYLGEESNDNISQNKVENLFDYLNLGVAKTGSLVAGGVDPKYILYPLGTLGQINIDDNDIAAQLEENATLFMQNILGSDWTGLKYFKEPEKNDFFSNANCFGIRVMGDDLTNEKTGGRDTLDLEFEIKLTTDFNNQESDEDERVQELYLVEKMEAIRKQLRLTKFFKASNVRIVRDWGRDEVEKVGTRILVCRAVVTVNLDIKNQ